ncbi:MAG: hypothetical protein AAGH19_03580 [Pseudomonadota bacterium]
MEITVRKSTAQFVILAGIVLATFLANPFAVVPAQANDEPLTGVQEIDLGILEVSQDRWTYEQEIVMRMIRKVYDKPRNNDPAYRDDWLCWIEKRALTSFGYLYCARNGDIEARSPSSALAGTPMGGYGTFLVSSDTVNRAKFERQLASFRGGEAFNDEFLELVMAGERPPRRVPRDRELETFAEIQTALQDLGEKDLSSLQKNELIKSYGMEPSRYYQVREHLNTYLSIRERLTELTDKAWVLGTLIEA